MNAVVEGIVAWKYDHDLDGFLASVAARFRRWDGPLNWQSNDRDIAVQADFRSGGHISLTWRISPWRQATGSWDASATVILEAGEQMAQAAAEIRNFLHPDVPHSVLIGLQPR